VVRAAGQGLGQGDTVAALRTAGTPVLQEPHSHFSGHRRAYVADPDGNWIVVASKER